MIKNCLHCKQPFEAPSANRKYCSRKCAAQVNSKARRTRVTLSCLVCGKSFTAVPSEIENGYGKYCSRDCANIGKQQSVEHTCELCGKTFMARPKEDRRFCSWECYLSRGIHHATCENCGKPFPTKPVLGRKFCSRKCYDETQRKRASAKINLTRGVEYGHEFTEELKELVRNRDKRTCQLCHAPESEQGPRLSVHHIDYDKSNNIPDNLISLCNSCHPKTNRNRRKWISRFAQTLNQS